MKLFKYTLLLSTLAVATTAAEATLYFGLATGARTVNYNSTLSGDLDNTLILTKQNADAQNIVGRVYIGKRFCLSAPWYADVQATFDYSPIKASVLLTTPSAGVPNAGIGLSVKNTYTYGIRTNIGYKIMENKHSVYGIFGFNSSHYKLTGNIVSASNNLQYFNLGLGYEIPCTERMKLRFEGEVSLYINRRIKHTPALTQISGALNVKNSNTFTVGFAYMLG